MFEICALLARKKTPKARKPAGPRIRAGVRVKVYGAHPGTVVGKHPTNDRWWNVDVDGRGVAGFDRSLITIEG